MKILLLEDDEGTQAMILTVLKGLDVALDIEAVRNGDDALARYLECCHDLVITDHAHPGMFGIEFIERVLGRNPSQPIILQTGNSGEHIEAFKRNHRDIPLLEKPYQPRVLQGTVRALLNR
jgi:CheY-like chemotaxis protein